jgi:hypothetical protein
MICLEELTARISYADERYGGFASTHEALGVAYEEWHEFVHAVQTNVILDIREEALDLAAVLIRLAESIHEIEDRSVK